jgi:universal stress protein E
MVPLLDEARQYHADCLARALAEAGVPRDRVHIHLVQQRASRAIIEAVAAIGPDLLVMGTLGRIGIPGFFIGNTAERVLDEVGCSLLVRKPAGFVSPVTAAPPM